MYNVFIILPWDRYWVGIFSILLDEMGPDCVSGWQETLNPISSVPFLLVTKFSLKLMCVILTLCTVPYFQSGMFLLASSLIEIWGMTMHLERNPKIWCANEACLAQHALDTCWSFCALTFAHENQLWVTMFCFSSIRNSASCPITGTVPRHLTCCVFITASQQKTGQGTGT